MQLLFKLLFDISHRSRNIPRKRKFCFFPGDDFENTPQNRTMALKKSRVVLRMNYSTFTHSTKFVA